MKTIIYIVMAVTLSITTLISTASDRAFAAAGSVVIAEVQTGSTGTASQEYVALYNNSALSVDVTGWCVRYNTSLARPGCIAAPSADSRVMLAPYSYADFASHELVVALSDTYQPQAGTFFGGMAGGGGTLTLIDAEGVVHDQFTWTSSLGSGLMYQRISGGALLLQDTDNDAVDFAEVPFGIHAGGIYTEAIPDVPDVCLNIANVQPELPDGYLRDTAGDCWLDVCLNLDGLQQEVPAGYEQISGNVCKEVAAVPLGSSLLDITELLPNASSYDTGKEFVELYNPNEVPVQLSGYVLKLGSSTSSYVFPEGIIQAKEYKTFSDTDIGFSLPNSSGQLQLYAPAGNLVSSTGMYNTPKDNMAWALIDGIWQFTNQPTPGQANQISGIVAGGLGGVSSGLGTCPAGKYRNPATNRCKNIESAESTLVPCAPGKARNPETNRCRSIAVAASAGLTPCRPGQVRNPATNRCRNAEQASSTLKPCREGQERNPDTNRCRNIPAVLSGATSNDDAQSRGNINIWIIGAVLTMITGYALYEYRYDMANLWLKVRKK